MINDRIAWAADDETWCHGSRPGLPNAQGVSNAQGCARCSTRLPKSRLCTQRRGTVASRSAVGFHGRQHRRRHGRTRRRSRRGSQNQENAVGKAKRACRPGGLASVAARRRCRSPCPPGRKWDGTPVAADSPGTKWSHPDARASSSSRIEPLRHRDCSPRSGAAPRRGLVSSRSSSRTCATARQPTGRLRQSPCRSCGARPEARSRDWSAAQTLLPRFGCRPRRPLRRDHRLDVAQRGLEMAAARPRQPDRALGAAGDGDHSRGRESVQQGCRKNARRTWPRCARSIGRGRCTGRDNEDRRRNRRQAARCRLQLTR